MDPLEHSLSPLTFSRKNILTKLFFAIKAKNMKPFFATLLLVTLLYSSFTEPTMAVSGSCNFKCTNRCARAGIMDRCMKYCGICCEQCNQCVPSGTYGNKHECPCYRDKINNKGKPKCP